MKLSSAVFVVAGCFFIITIASMVAQWQSGQEITILLQQDRSLRQQILATEEKQLHENTLHSHKLTAITDAQKRVAERLALTEQALQKTRSDTEHQLLEIQHHVGSLPNAQGHPAFHAPAAQVLVKGDLVKAVIVTPFPTPFVYATFVPTAAPSPAPSPTVRPPLPVFTVATRAPILPTPKATASPTSSPNPCHTFLFGKVCR